MIDQRDAIDCLTDACGVIHSPVPSNVSPRIVCLVPSITELLFDLGLEKFLVGRTGFCIHPRDRVGAVPKVGGTKDVNLKKIRQLEPTHLIVNIDENEKPTVDQLSQFIPHVIVTHPLNPQDNLHLYRMLGAIFNVNIQAEQLCQAFQDAISNVRVDMTPKHVLYCIWKDPWMTVSEDTYIAQNLALRGWINVFPQAHAVSPKRYPQFEWDDPILANTDLIMLSTEPYSFTHQHCEELQRTLLKPVILVDGEMLSWYGSRAIQGLRYLQNLNI
ncbi:helical backbone metal receptor [Undibacterium fentianense]|uniref:ABC transporter substrate-binding protein n=1 Tax=Undibacterium fentianense TaxID=2828728 RepID=A0A941E8L6_9BURK|nr:helical backbone metal receptor [Undibacterium fentianense]MBR7801763.1 ABC transporter substrate-binding protein [Undibacterium fentianense]